MRQGFKDLIEIGYYYVFGGLFFFSFHFDYLGLASLVGAFGVMVFGLRMFHREYDLRKIIKGEFKIK